MIDRFLIEWRRVLAAAWAAFLTLGATPSARGYAFDEIVPDVRQPVSISGGSACPVRAHQLSAPGSIAVRWSTVLGTNPVTILTQNPTGSAQLNEIAQVIQQSLAVWTGVSGTSLAPSAVTPLTSTTEANACGSDGINSICFDQADDAFTPGVLAFTRVITADAIGVQVGSGAPATEIGQILDADIYFDPSDSQIAFATPTALTANPQAYDLESLLTHEFGHLLGFSHSAVWGAMMYPFAPAPGTYTAQDRQHRSQMRRWVMTIGLVCVFCIRMGATLCTWDRSVGVSFRRIHCLCRCPRQM